MALTSSVAMVVLLVASGVGWWSGRRLVTAANHEVLRRRARWCVTSAILVVAAGTALVGATALRWGPEGPSTAELLQVALIGIPVLVTWAVTIPRAWVVVRRRRAADPLHWPDGRVRVEVAGPELVVPFAASLFAAIAGVVLLSSSGQSTITGVLLAVLIVGAATAYVDARQRQDRARLARPYLGTQLTRSRVLQGSGVTR